MTATLRVVMAQLDMLVGDIPGNAAKVINAAKQARDQHQADVIVFPELTLTGYPPEDLLLRPSLQLRVSRALEQVCAEVEGITLVLGYPWREPEGLYNQAAVIADGAIQAVYRKQNLPNYQVFDEKRYFVAGHSPCVVDIKGRPVAITICEDMWLPQPVLQAREAGAELVINLNASPFHLGKWEERRKLLVERARQAGCPILYVNQVGGQDELIFDGGSMVMDAEGDLAVSVPCFTEALYPVDFCLEGQIKPVPQPLRAAPGKLESAYQALVMGVRDYVNKNGFKGVVLGLSGGIDSALTLAVAADALGKERVAAVMMPFRYTSDMSLEDAAKQATDMGVNYQVMSIEPMYESFMATLADSFSGTGADKTEENLQSRCRGVLLMALSNKLGYLVLTTGNKSEMAVGYATLYGDMAGGFDVLKDVPKTLVFELARYRNSLGQVIPERVITRPPSAELAPGQVDEDSLPPYPVLDRILELYVEKDYSAHAIIEQGFAEADVLRVLRLVDLNEYKRRQAAIGPRLTARAFGRDRRYPITSGWRIGE
ncbi:NAD+ synthase [Balneatrix alpica]|uniref:Glutamine-dependent NAD(+) synthetase n=1 Tax=Balneatrix alpica TaxID=75684 RepID=A0ABV5ZE49_9GAMM|nr:NAD+ synthase [Balneatrix alpica]